MVLAAEEDVAGSFNRNRCGQKAKPATNSSTVSKWTSKPTKTVKWCFLSSIWKRPLCDLRALHTLNVLAVRAQGLKRYRYAERDSARRKKSWRVFGFRLCVANSDTRTLQRTEALSVEADATRKKASARGSTTWRADALAPRGKSSTRFA